jgi:hypothetical protein
VQSGPVKQGTPSGDAAAFPEAFRSAPTSADPRWTVATHPPCGVLPVRVFFLR